jgi:outer membrane protein
MRRHAVFNGCFRRALIFAALFAAAGAQAQTVDDRGFQAGDFLIRIRAIGVIPEDSSSSISSIGGKVNVTPTPAPELDLSYFFTDHIAAELIAASTRHDISARDTTLGSVDVGSTYILPPTLTVQYHFLPRGFIDPYLGVGLNVSFWYDTNPAGGAVTKVGLNTVAGPAIQAGFNVKLGHGLFGNFDVKQIFIDPQARINGGAIVAKTHLDPTVVGAGIGLRF